VTVRVVGTGIVGELVCGIGGTVLIDVGGFGKRQVLAVLVEPVPGTPDERLESDIIAAALRRERQW
jgi:hypothetical protein